MRYVSIHVKLTGIKHKQRCEQREITAIKTSNESQLFSRKHFRKSSIIFRIYADFGADNEIDKSSVGKKTTKIYKQNPVCNDY